MVGRTASGMVAIKRSARYVRPPADVTETETSASRIDCRESLKACSRPIQKMLSKIRRATVDYLFRILYSVQVSSKKSAVKLCRACVQVSHVLHKAAAVMRIK